MEFGQERAATHESIMNSTKPIDDFEEAWQRRNFATIDRMLADKTLSPELVAELVMIDLEYRWRYPLSSSHRGKALIPNCPRIEDYLRSISNLQNDSCSVLELVGEEYRVRLQWAEQPSAEEFFDRFPNHRDELQAAFETIDRDVPHVCIAVLQRQKPVFQTRLHRELIVGRQAVHDPQPFCLCNSDGDRKLVVAPLDQLDVSRRQLRIQISGIEICLQNLSSQVVIQTASGFDLHPDQTIRHRVPMNLGFGGIQLRISK